jgi:hypothetical protein
VGEAILVAWGKDEAAAQLKGIASEFVLLMAGSAGAIAAFEIVEAQDVQNIGGAELGDSVCLALLVDQEREIDGGLFAEDASVVSIAEADRGDKGAFVPEGLLVLAQLRDVLAAKDSAIVTKENDNGGLALPQGTETDFAAVGIGKRDVRELTTERIAHADHHWRAVILCQDWRPEQPCADRGG